MKPTIDRNPLFERLKRYCSDACTQGEAAATEVWLLRHLHESEYDDLFERLFAELPAATDPAAKSRAREQLERFLSRSGGAVAPYGRRRLWRSLLWGVQTAVVVVLAVTASVFYHRTDDTQSWVEAYAPYGETRCVALPDGSQVWLRADSRIIYPRRFGNKTRRVFASGEIFADVAKDPQRPFLVEADGVAVRVLGTKFNLKAYREANNVELSLLEGSVSLTVTPPDAGSTELLLRPGNTVRVDRRSGCFERYEFDVDAYTSWKDRRMFRFMNQTLEEIVAELQSSFDVQIVIRDDELRSMCYLASFVNGESLEQILASLNTDRQMNISRQGNVIILSRGDAAD